VTAPEVFVVQAPAAALRHCAAICERAGWRFRATPVQAGPISAGAGDEAEDAPVTPLLLRLERTAEALDVSPSTLKRLIRDGQLPAVKVQGATRVRVADLQSYVEHLGADPDSPTPGGP